MNSFIPLFVAEGPLARHAGINEPAHYTNVMFLREIEVKNNPTDLELLQCIFDLYREDFALYDSDNSIRKDKIYVPIDCKLIATKLNADPELVFGRLYYHLANVYTYQHDKNIVAKLFEWEFEGQKHCIQFPILASVVANLKAEHDKYKHTLLASAFAVVVATAAAIITAYDVFGAST